MSGNLDQLGLFPVTRNLLGEMDQEQDGVIEALGELDDAEKFGSEIARLKDALLAVFLDPLGSHGAHALARETLGIPFIPFASPETMFAAWQEQQRSGA